MNSTTNNVLTNGAWTLEGLRAGLHGLKPNGLKVFSCFHCGGGSSMGYKLAGFDVIGGVEIDERMSKLYVKNLQPKFEFLKSIRDFNNEIPQELIGKIDILDGSPPCSVFSMSGKREAGWGKEKKFREGQSDQRLDDLFIHFIKTAELLKPRIVIAENVPAMLLGNSRYYVTEIVDEFKKIGMKCRVAELYASVMGVPQRRRRLFFIAGQESIIEKVDLNFHEDEIPISIAVIGATRTDGGKNLTGKTLNAWKQVIPGQQFSSYFNGSRFNWSRLNGNNPARTITSAGAKITMHWSEPRTLTIGELIRAQSFPDDYDFGDEKPGYVIGMSVPPLMMQRLAMRLQTVLL